jgi:hypothetical protein
MVARHTLHSLSTRARNAGAHPCGESPAAAAWAAHPRPAAVQLGQIG